MVEIDLLQKRKPLNLDPKIAWSDLRENQETQLASLARNGDTRSMVGMAYMRLNAADPRYDPKAAADFLLKAANAGSAEAQFELAQLFEKGLGVDQDLQRAFELFKASADQEFADALNDLGFIYYQGGLNVVPNQKLGLDYQVSADPHMYKKRHPKKRKNLDIALIKLIEKFV